MELRRGDRRSGLFNAHSLGLGQIPGLEGHIRPCLNGRDFTSTPRCVWIVDLFGLEAEQVRSRFPAVYQHLLERAKPERDLNRNAVFRRTW